MVVELSQLHACMQAFCILELMPACILLDSSTQIVSPPSVRVEVYTSAFKLAMQTSLCPPLPEDDQHCPLELKSQRLTATESAQLAC